jgi:hypothetical protein
MDRHVPKGRVSPLVHVLETKVLRDIRKDLEAIKTFVDEAEPYKLYAGMCGKSMTSGKLAIIKAVIGRVTAGLVDVSFTTMVIDLGSWSAASLRRE